MKPLQLNHRRLVKDVMQRDLITVKFDTPLVEAVAKMKNHQISGLIVVDNIGEFVGVVSALDVFKALNQEREFGEYTVEEVMTPFTITIHHQDTLASAAKTMMENNIHRLVVTESPVSRRPVGIITSTDLINSLF